MSTTWALLISLLLLAFNAFFVAAEFALVAAKRHRLEAVAATGSRAARAALAASRQLSLMLAGAQLGITLCTLGLGALAKPTVAYLLEPALAAIGLPESAGYVIAFMLAIALVGFLHVVIGEMAPKSWAISDPERSALLLGQPFGWFTRLARPVLAVLNGLANAALRAIKVTPQDELAQAHGPAELRLLLESSRDSGTLPVRDHRLLTSILGLQHTTVDQVMTPIAEVVTIPATAGAREIELTGHRHGRSRLLVTAQDSQITGIVHVRDAARAHHQRQQRHRIRPDDHAAVDASRHQRCGRATHHAGKNGANSPSPPTTGPSPESLRSKISSNRSSATSTTKPTPHQDPARLSRQFPLNHIDWPAHAAGVRERSKPRGEGAAPRIRPRPVEELQNNKCHNHPRVSRRGDRQFGSDGLHNCHYRSLVTARPPPDGSRSVGRLVGSFQGGSQKSEAVEADEDGGPFVPGDTKRQRPGADEPARRQWVGRHRHLHMPEQ